MSEKTKRLHRYKPETPEIVVDELSEQLAHYLFLEWRERIDARPAGSIAFAPEAK